MRLRFITAPNESLLWSLARAQGLVRMNLLESTHLIHNAHTPATFRPIRSSRARKHASEPVDYGSTGGRWHVAKQTFSKEQCWYCRVQKRQHVFCQRMHGIWVIRSSDRRQILSKIQRDQGVHFRIQPGSALGNRVRLLTVLRRRAGQGGRKRRVGDDTTCFA